MAAEVIDETKRCPFCAETIMAAAVKCRHCGELLDMRLRAMPQNVAIAGQAKPMLIERTGKKWKGARAIGVLLILGGFTMLFAGIAGRAPAISVLGVPLILVGFPVYLFARFGAWWFHG